MKRFSPDRPPMLPEERHREYWRAMTEEIKRGTPIGEHVFGRKQEDEQ